MIKKDFFPEMIATAMGARLSKGEWARGREGTLRVPGCKWFGTQGGANQVLVESTCHPPWGPGGTFMYRRDLLGDCDSSLRMSTCLERLA